MNIDTQIAMLDQLYKIYNEFISNIANVCKKYCSCCCTINVTLTTLECYKLVNHITSNKKFNLFKQTRNQSNNERFQPVVTTNKLADLCVAGKDLPKETNDNMDKSCPLLSDNKCSVYQARPFNCICFTSKQNCSDYGYATTDPFVITVNNVFLQYIEHIDANGFSGNLTDMLLFMESKDNLNLYKKNMIRRTDKIISNQPVKYLLIPEEHRQKIKPVINAINSKLIHINKKGKNLK